MLTSKQQNELDRKAQSEKQQFVADFRNMIDRMADIERVNAEMQKRDADRGITPAQRLSRNS